MVKSTKSAFHDMKKSYRKAKKQERKRSGLSVNKKPYYWEKYSIKSKPYKQKPVKEIKLPKSLETMNNDEKPQEGCYIATCVYGSYDCPEVWTLRRFRDDCLKKTWYGRLFIKGYYAISPTMVRYYGNKKWFRVFWKKWLDRWVRRLNEKPEPFLK